MRNKIRKLIKESLYDNMERDLTLPSGKVLPNFKGILLSLISRDPDFAKQALVIIEDIEPYDIFEDPYSILKSKVTDYSTFYSVRLYVRDKEVVDAFEKEILNHPGYNHASTPLFQRSGFLDRCQTKASSCSMRPASWHSIGWNVDK